MAFLRQAPREIENPARQHHAIVGGEVRRARRAPDDVVVLNVVAAHPFIDALIELEQQNGAEEKCAAPHGIAAREQGLVGDPGRVARLSERGSRETERQEQRCERTCHESSLWLVSCRSATGVPVFGAAKRQRRQMSEYRFQNSGNPRAANRTCPWLSLNSEI